MEPPYLEVEANGLARSGEYPGREAKVPSAYFVGLAPSLEGAPRSLQPMVKLPIVNRRVGNGEGADRDAGWRSSLLA